MLFIYLYRGDLYSVNNLGHKAPPWGSPFMTLIFLEVSRPCLVVATTLVFQLAHNLHRPSPSQIGSLARFHQKLVILSGLAHSSCASSFSTCEVGKFKTVKVSVCLAKDLKNSFCLS